MKETYKEAYPSSQADATKDARQRLCDGQSVRRRSNGDHGEQRHVSVEADTLLRD